MNIVNFSLIVKCTGANLGNSFHPGSKKPEKVPIYPINRRGQVYSLEESTDCFSQSVEKPDSWKEICALYIAPETSFYLSFRRD
jgi:hypothetical protein